MKTLRHFVTIGLFFFPLIAFAQDTIYYNFDGEKVDTKLKAAYYQTLVKENVRSNKLLERQYYMSGQPKKETYYLELNKKIKDGTQKIWYNNGQLKSAVDYVDNKYQGNVLTYWENGQLKRKDTFENDKFLSGACYDSIGNHIQHFEFLVFPTFPGGDKMLLEYLKKNIRYPSLALEHGIYGRVVIKFVVAKDGTPTKFGIKTSVDRDLDMEAMRVVRAMPKWTPCYYDGEPLDFWYLLPIVFKEMDSYQVPSARVTR